MTTTPLEVATPAQAGGGRTGEPAKGADSGFTAAFAHAVRQAHAAHDPETPADPPSDEDGHGVVPAETAAILALPGELALLHEMVDDLDETVAALTEPPADPVQAAGLHSAVKSKLMKAMLGDAAPTRDDGLTDEPAAGPATPVTGLISAIELGNLVAHASVMQPQGQPPNQGPPPGQPQPQPPGRPAHRPNPALIMPAATVPPNTVPTPSVGPQVGAMPQTTPTQPIDQVAPSTPNTPTAPAQPQLIAGQPAPGAGPGGPPMLIAPQTGGTTPSNNLVFTGPPTSPSTAPIPLVLNPSPTIDPATGQPISTAPAQGATPSPIPPDVHAGTTPTTTPTTPGGQAPPATPAPGTTPAPGPATVPATAPATTPVTTPATTPATGPGPATQSPTLPGAPPVTPTVTPTATETAAGRRRPQDDQAVDVPPETKNVDPTAALAGAPQVQRSAEAAPLPTATPMPFASPAQQVAMQLAPLRRGPDGVHRLTVHLNPAELGPVSVVAEVRGGAIAVQIHGGTEAARAALQAALPDLRRDLLDAGFGSCALDMSGQTGGSSSPQTGGQSQPQSQAQSQPQPQQQPSQQQAWSRSAESAELFTEPEVVDEAPTTAERARRIMQRALDLKI
jgi:hypothetical protein